MYRNYHVNRPVPRALTQVTEKAEAIVKTNKHNTLTGERVSWVHRSTPANESAGVDPEHNRQRFALGRRRAPYIQIKALHIGSDSEWLI
jgi:hypothetical protein